MKFGLLLKQNCVHEWGEKYVDYQKLKLLINSIIENNVPVSQIASGHSQWKMSVVQERFYSPQRWETELDNLNNSRLSVAREKPDCIFEWLKQNPPECDFEADFLSQIAREHAKVESFFFEKSQHYGKKLKELIPLTKHTIKNIKGSVRLKIEYNFKELWRGLQLLTNYRIWNFMGFAKILKKHDKNSLLKVSGELMSLIECSQFAKSTLCDDCMGLLEKKFSELFGDGSQKRSKIISTLSSQEAEECTSAEFFTTGVLIGVGLACVSFLVFLFNVVPSVLKKYDKQVIEAEFPMIRFLLFLSLIGYLTALNLRV